MDANTQMMIAKGTDPVGNNFTSMRTSEDKFLEETADKSFRSLTWARENSRYYSPPTLGWERQHNLSTAYPEVNWDFDSAICRNYGWLGDKPQFVVKGSYTTFHFYYTWAGPGGSNSNLKVFNCTGKKVFHKNPAPFKNAAEIWKDFIYHLEKGYIR